MDTRIIAVDWSGAREPLRNLWLAEATPESIVEVRRFETRRALTDHLIAQEEQGRSMVIGLDFAFSLPAWFLDQEGLDSAPDLWERMRSDAERWLEPRPPFWGNDGRPEIEEEFRQTDRDVVNVAGKRPSSPFKLVGSDQVGRGSLRGMPCLARLAAAGLRRCFENVISVPSWMTRACAPAAGRGG